ncbi:MAG TPA: LPS export ABC transporter permease LptF [Rhodanobacteraceae bacterium]
MLRILDRYIFREVAVSALAVTFVLLVVLAGDVFARVLQQVAEGSYPAGVMFEILGLKLLGASSIVVPMALFLGELWALGRLYQDREMDVLAASGMGPRGLIWPVTLLAVICALLAGMLSLWLRPWSEDMTARLITSANQSVVAAGLQAGRFTELPGGGIIYADGVSRRGTHVQNVFMARQYLGQKGAPPVLRVVTAKQGQLQLDADGAGRVLALTDGWQYQIPLGAKDWDRMHYRGNDVALNDVSQGANSEAEGDASVNGTIALWHKTDSRSRARLVWRMTAPVAVLVLALLALPLARQGPRESRYGRLLIGVLGFFLYFSVLTLADSLIGRGFRFGLVLIWLVQLVVPTVCIGFVWRHYASRRKSVIKTR